VIFLLFGLFKIKFFFVFLHRYKIEYAAKLEKLSQTAKYFEKNFQINFVVYCGRTT